MPRKVGPAAGQDAALPDWLVPRLLASLDVSKVPLPEELRVWLAAELKECLEVGLCALPNGGVSPSLEVYGGLRLAVRALTSTKSPPLSAQENREMRDALEHQRQYHLTWERESADSRRRAANIVQLCDLVEAAMASAGVAHV